MSTELRKNGKTCVATSYPWGLTLLRGTRLLCSDGKVRAVAYLARTPDTFFSTPAAVRIRGNYITGYMTAEECSETGRQAYVFRHHTAHALALPEWPKRFEAAHSALVALAYAEDGK